jgi:hypothetical protein
MALGAARAAGGGGAPREPGWERGPEGGPRSLLARPPRPPSLRPRPRPESRSSRRKGDRDL